MQGLRKSKRVSWESDVNLCQTRLFLSEDVPAQVGLGAEDHLQVKATWTSHLDGVGLDDILPPGFEGIQPVGVLKSGLAHIPVIKWKPPPKFVLSPKWLVVSGEESREVNVQTQREMRMLEAIYPRPSAIPSNPLLAGAEESSHDDQVTPVVPITAIEEEDEEEEFKTTDPSHLAMGTNSDAKSLWLPMSSTIQSSQDSPVASGMEPHLVAAAQAALGAALSDSDQGNLIDRDILLRILTDPQMVAQLINNVGASSGTQNLATVGTLPVLPMPNISNTPEREFAERPLPVNIREPLIAQVSKPELLATSVAAASNASLYPPGRIDSLPGLRPAVPGTAVPPPSLAPPALKDANYYKNLIKQHGEERQDNLPQFSSGSNQHLAQISVNNSKPRDPKHKITKPCMFYNTARGCRNGANCPFQHDSSSQLRGNGIPDVQHAKRFKLDRDISGT